MSMLVRLARASGIQKQRLFGVARPFSTSGGLLTDEERAAENIFIKKQEAEKAAFLRKLKETKNAQAAEAAAKAAGETAHAEELKKVDAKNSGYSGAAVLAAAAAGFIFSYSLFSN